MRGPLRQWWFAVLPAVIGLGLAVWDVGRAGPWLDELYTMNAVSRGLGLHLFEAPILPYYALAWLWSGGGVLTSIEWLRLLSGVALAVGAVPVALAGRRLLNERAGFVAALLFVMAPGMDRYAQEARVYAVAAALAAVSTWALVAVLTGGRRRWWLLYGLSLGTAAILLPTAWAVVPAHAVILLTDPRWRQYARDALTTILLLLPVVVLDVLLGLSFRDLHVWLAVPTISDLPSGLWNPVHSEYTGAAVPVLLVVLSLFSGLGRRWLLGLAASAVVIWLVSYLLGSWWTARTFLPLASILCLAAAGILARAAWPVVAAVLVAVLVLAIPDYRAIREEGSRGPDVRAIADLIDEHGQSGDQITVEGSYPLDWAYALFLEDDDRGFVLVKRATGGPYWEVGAQPSCERFEEWTVTGNALLRRCS